MSRLTIRTAAAVLVTALLASPLFANHARIDAADKPATVTALTESRRANQLFDDIFDRAVMRSPQTQTALGIKRDYDKWDDLSEANRARELAHDKADLALLRQLDYEALDESTRLSYRLLEQQLLDSIEDYQWRHHNYPVNQMFGIHSRAPALLINQHSIGSIAEAEAYIARLHGMAPMIDQLMQQLKIREEKGIIAPDFVFQHVIRDSGNILRGAPFEQGADSTLLADFNGKIDRLELSPGQREELSRAAEEALRDSVQPAYTALIAYLEQLQDKATADAGVWKLPRGDEFYQVRLQRITTTDLTPTQVHEIGLAEVARIHAEMDRIREKVGFEGDLRAFMDFMRDDSRFYFSQDDQGREEYLAQASAVLDEIDARLGELFLVRPRAALQVKRVEEFRERSAGKAFYERPAPDGSRPGKYYANLYDMSQMPSYQLEALAYHEGLPGHHMQIAIKQELEDLPKFRRFGGVTAYSEGWGLYSELLPKEIGLYEDPYSDFGRLAMELWRAVRLVVDTGMHAKGWSREQSIDYYAANTPNARADAVRMVERHAVMPGQATAYKIGMLKILQEREKAREALSADFDIREFHNAVLKNGAVPLDVLEQQVDSYIERKRGSVETASTCIECEETAPASRPAG
jgi:uncharacterized protein (DUF885 family)